MYIEIMLSFPPTKESWIQYRKFKQLPKFTVPLVCSVPVNFVRIYQEHKPGMCDLYLYFPLSIPSSPLLTPSLI